MFNLRKPVEGREATDLILLGKAVVLSRVNLGNVHVLLLKNACSSCIFRGKLFAVTAIETI